MLLLAALALVAAGCGGDDSNEAGGDTDTAVVETDGEETTDDATETTDDDAALGGECAEFAGLGARIFQAVSSGPEGIQEASELFDRLKGRVPDEIKADFDVIAENFAEIAEAVRDADLTAEEMSSPEGLAKLQELMAPLSSPEVAAAGERLQAWAEKNC